MRATEKEAELITMLRIAEKYNVIDKDDAVNILLLLKTDEQREEMMQYMAAHPEAETKELYEKTAEIIKAEWVDPDQI